MEGDGERIGLVASASKCWMLSKLVVKEKKKMGKLKMDWKCQEKKNFPARRREAYGEKTSDSSPFLTPHPLAATLPQKARVLNINSFSTLASLNDPLQFDTDAYLALLAHAAHTHTSKSLLFCASPCTWGGGALVQCELQRRSNCIHNHDLLEVLEAFHNNPRILYEVFN